MDFKAVAWKGVNWMNLAQDGETWQAFLFMYCYYHPFIDLRSTD
jgi:hypothetical protein